MLAAEVLGRPICVPTNRRDQILRAVQNKLSSIRGWRLMAQKQRVLIWMTAPLVGAPLLSLLNLAAAVQRQRIDSPVRRHRVEQRRVALHRLRRETLPTVAVFVPPRADGLAGGSVECLGEEGPAALAARHRVQIPAHDQTTGPLSSDGRAYVMSCLANAPKKRCHPIPGPQVQV